MTHRKLPQAIKAYRIGDPNGKYPIMSGDGAKSAPGRWNDIGQGVIYASEYYSTAILEKLVRLGEMPPDQHFVEILIERGVSYEEFNEAKAPDWFDRSRASARAYGAAWFREKRSCVLFVPSVAARLDRNVLIHPEHEDFALIRPSRERPLWWDERLFAA